MNLPRNRHHGSCQCQWERQKRIGVSAQAKRPALPLQYGANRDGSLTLAPSPSRGFLTINAGTPIRPLALLACRRKRSVPLCLFSTEQTGTVRLRWHRPEITRLPHHQRRHVAARSPFWRVGVSEASRFASSVRSKPGRFAYAGTSPKSRGSEKRFPVLLVISFCRVWLSAVRSEKTGHWVPGIVLYPNADNSRMTTDTDNW